jgi:hypothetical protein
MDHIKTRQAKGVMWKGILYRTCIYSIWILILVLYNMLSSEVGTARSVWVAKLIVLFPYLMRCEDRGWHVLDSLVCVSRRDIEKHFVRVPPNEIDNTNLFYQWNMNKKFLCNWLDIVSSLNIHKFWMDMSHGMLVRLCDTFSWWN